MADEGNERRKSILLAVMEAVHDLVKVKTVASEIKSRIDGFLECQFNLNDSTFFRGNMWLETSKLVCSLLQHLEYTPNTAHLPPEEQNIEADETGAERERMKSILLEVVMAVNDLVKKRTVASEIKSRIPEVVECQFNLNDSYEFRAAASTKTAVLVESLLQNF